jgi:hypothetical protein
VAMEVWMEEVAMEVWMEEVAMEVWMEEVAMERIYFYYYKPSICISLL